MKQLIKRSRIGTGLTALSALVMTALAQPVLAAAPDLTDLTDSVDFSTVTTAVLSVAGALIGVYIVYKAAGLVIRAVRGL